MTDIKSLNPECAKELKLQALQFFVSQLAQTHSVDMVELHIYMKSLVKVIQLTAYYSLKHRVEGEVTGEDFTPESIQRAAELFSTFSYLMHNPESRAEYEKELENDPEKEHIKILQKHAESVLKEMPQLPKFTPRIES